jgi:hypothetical protein
MKSLSVLPLIFSFATALPTQRQTEATCTTCWSAINGLIVELERRVREGEDSFLFSLFSLDPNPLPAFLSFLNFALVYLLGVEQ